MRVITGDIGGTKTRLAWLEVAADAVRPLKEQQFPSRQFDGLETIIALFIEGLDGPVEAAGFGIAGPVHGRLCHATNLPWKIDGDAIANRFGIPRVELLNDLEATAWGIALLPPEDFVTLHEGLPGAAGNAAVIAAGTGLGEAGLCRSRGRFTPFATEGGHSDFAPRDALEWALLDHLRQRFDHVSWERVVSGPGLVNLFQFLSAYRNRPVPEGIASRMEREDPAAVIADEAGREEDGLCVEAMRLFVRLYGAEAGNLALKLMATGGIYVGGGIAPKILPWLSTGEFMEACHAKGRMRGLMESMPVKVILNDRAALLGPAGLLARR